MNGKHYIGKKVSHIEKYDETAPISGVALLLDENNQILAGDQNGFVLDIGCPYGTQAMANDILAKVRGHTYKGFRADNAPLPINAELGDGVTVDGLYSILAYLSVNFGPGHFSEIAAPGENELRHEYNYLTPNEKLSRKIAGTNSRITKTAEQIRLEVSNEVAGLNSYIELTAQKLTTQITNVNEGLTSKIEQTAGSLTTKIEDTQKGLSSEIKQTASGLQSQITTAKGDISTLTQTANSLQSQITTANGNIAILTQTDSKLQSQITTANGNISTLTQTAKDLKSEITNVNKGLTSKIEQTAKSITLSVSNSGTSSIITLSGDGVTTQAKEIKFTGLVSFSDLSTSGKTTINGANIKTGKIDAERLNLTGAITFNDMTNDTYNTINGAVNKANAAANNVEALADGNYSGTFIDGHSLYSPEIYAQYFYVYADDTDGGFYLYGRYRGSRYAMFAVEYNIGEAPYVDIFSPADAFIYLNGNIRFTGNVDFSAADVTGL